MKIIYGGRQSGKTTRLIKVSAENGGYIVCRSKEECNRIFNQATKMGLNIRFPVTYHEVITGDYYGRGILEFYIDDVDLFIRTVCRGVRVEAVTFTPFGSLEKLETPKHVKDMFNKDQVDIDSSSDFSKLIK